MAMQQRKRRKKRSRVSRPKICRFCEEGILYIDFKDDDMLLRYLTEKGKILPRRITGTCNNHQKMLATAIKRARTLALIK